MKRWKSFTIAALSMLALGVKGQENVSTDADPSAFCSLRSYEECDLKKYEKNFLGSLDYPANEIIESGLAQVAMLKLAQPQTQCKKLKKKVDDLALHGATATVRYKAYLTGMVFEHPELFPYEKYGSYRDGDELFRVLSQQLSRETLAAY